MQSGGMPSVSKLGFKKSLTIQDRGSRMGGIGSKFGMQRQNSLNKVNNLNAAGRGGREAIGASRMRVVNQNQSRL